MKRIVILTALACLVVPCVLVQADVSETDKQILGGWQLAMTTPDGEDREPVVIIGRQNDKYCAWYVGKEGLEAFKSVKLDGDAIVGTIMPKEEPGITISMEAELTGKDKCEGEATFKSPDGDAGSWEFTGKKIPVSSATDPSVWAVKFTTPDYEEHEATVSVARFDGMLVGWYSSKDLQIPAQKVKIDGNEVVLVVSAETRDGDKVSVTFSGTAAGDTVEGTAEYELGNDTGSFPFTAKRKS